MSAKVAISLSEKELIRVDRLVKEGAFPSRSKLIQDAIAEKLERIDHRRLARECAKLDPGFEQALAEETFGYDVTEWPEY